MNSLSHKKRMRPRSLGLISAICITATVAGAEAPSLLVPSPSNIQPNHKFSWAENIGWMNWRDANLTIDGVVVRADYLSGYIWCENVGWVDVGDGNGPYGNTCDLDFGVNRLRGGDLDGYAWGENIGWLNFGWAAGTANPDRARYDAPSNRLYGWVWGENIGWINLDDATHYVGVNCTSDDQCDDFDACTCDRCVGSLCTNTPRLYGDVDCSGVINVFDMLCQLDLIAGGGASTMPGCNFSNADIHPCAGNGVLSVLDVLAVLDTFNLIDPCCGTNVCCIGTTCSLDSEANCVAAGGTFMPGVVTCNPNPCTGPAPAGRRPPAGSFDGREVQPEHGSLARPALNLDVPTRLSDDPVND